MPKKTIGEPVYDKSRDRWKVTIPAGLAADGKRVRSWHLTREAARKYIASVESPTDPSATIPPKLAMLADEAREILVPFDLDLVQGARDLAAALRVLDGTGTILEAAQAYREAHDRRTASKPLGLAVEIYLDSRQDLRASTLGSYSYTLEKVLLPLHHLPLADIATTDLETILAAKGATARKMHRRNLNAFWAWASKPPREWATMTPLTSLEAPRTSNDADIAVLSPGDVKALMSAAEAEGPGAAAAYALAVFGGVRMAELGKLTWGTVTEDHIEIGAAIAKKHSRRLIPICPTLRSWLDATRGDAEDTDSITPANWTEVSKNVRCRAGWAVVARLLSDPPKPTRGSWPANGCRHTCASVLVAIGTPLETLTFQFGHSGGHDLLKKHYVSRLTKKDAFAILAVGPGGSKVKQLAAV